MAPSLKPETHIETAQRVTFRFATAGALGVLLYVIVNAAPVLQ